MLFDRELMKNDANSSEEGRQGRTKGEFTLNERGKSEDKESHGSMVNWKRLSSTKQSLPVAKTGWMKHTLAGCL